MEITWTTDNSGEGIQYYDATAVTNMLAGGVLDFSGAKVAQVGGRLVPVIPTKEEYTEPLTSAYRSVGVERGWNLADPARQWDSPNAAFRLAGEFQSLDKAMAIELGTASFGRPRVKTAEEAGLKLTEQVARSDDVYLFEFAVTFWDLPSLEELAFRIDCKEPCLAWELAPLKVLSTDETTTTYGTPSVTVKGVTVGEMFKRQIVYESVRPQIVAFGLRENQFSWLMREDAASVGSHLFVAAIGVPKGAQSVQFSLSAAAKTEAWITEGRWISSKPEDITVRLR